MKVGNGYENRYKCYSIKFMFHNNFKHFNINRDVTEANNITPLNKCVTLWRQLSRTDRLFCFVYYYYVYQISVKQPFVRERKLIYLNLSFRNRV